MQHTKYECKCNHQFCQFCDGGLFVCTVCGGFEGSLPTDCPTEKMTQDEQDQIYGGQLDYREGSGWVRPDGTGRSMGDTDIRYSRRIVNQDEYEKEAASYKESASDPRGWFSDESFGDEEVGE